MISPGSIEFRLTAWYSLLLMLGLTAMSGVLWFGVDYAMVGALDDMLTARASGMVDYVKVNLEDDADEDDDEDDEPGGSLRDEIIEDLVEYTQAMPDGEFAEIRLIDGTSLFPPPDIADALAVPWLNTAGPLHRSLRVGDAWFRILATEVFLGDDRIRIQLVTPMAAVVATRDTLLGLALWIAPLGLVMSVAGGAWISRRALRPIERITRVASHMDLVHLSERLSVPQSGDVVQQLAETFNQMLGRLEGSLARLEEFTADASHELRGPVAVIRTTAELDLNSRRSEKELRRSLAEIHKEATLLTRLIDDLLTLARADSGVEAGSGEAVFLGDLVRDTCRGFEAQNPGYQLTTDIDPGLPPVQGSEPLLRRLVAILVDNAIRHTPPGSRVRVTLARQPGATVFEVVDDGEGMASETLARVFDRFYRADSARPRSDGGFGLGLSIAQWIVDFHGGTISARSEVGNGSRFSVILPDRSL